MKQLLIVLALILPAVACSGTETDPSASQSPMTVVLEESEHEVRCGCKIDGINRCGNYVDVAGEWKEISNREAMNLGKMEWCKETETVKATVAGTVTADQIEVTKLDVAKK